MNYDFEDFIEKYEARIRNNKESIRKLFATFLWDKMEEYEIDGPMLNKRLKTRPLFFTRLMKGEEKLTVEKILFIGSAFID